MQNTFETLPEDPDELRVISKLLLAEVKPDRVVAKIEWHPGELFSRVGFVVTNLPMEPDWILRLYNQWEPRTAHQGRQVAIRWTQLSCAQFRDNEARLQLDVLAFNLGVFF